MTTSPPLLLNDLSAAQRQRLAYIEFRVWFYGAVARKDVLERFELATAAGTRDLALYKELAPNNVAYERKNYLYQAGFAPLFSHDVNHVLAALTSGVGALDALDAGRSGEQLSHAVPARLNQPRLETLATVTRAIHAGHALQLTYHSMKKGAGARTIVPHSLVDSGLRWHVRAFDRTKGHFRDLVLTRMERLRTLTGAPQPTAEEHISADGQWNQAVALRLVPHPAHPHAKTIERDFGMQQGSLAVVLRAAIAGYVLRQWQVDCSADARLRGPECRLWLAEPQQLAGVDNAVLAPGYAMQA
ncbi:MAG: WYL domain-containing protein [Giesbergeria sp.]|nr:WYL domain-containing protein [Giesbergeria sp.]MBP6419816.1 WYL domain-containing protein [Giesbergeria sp.]